VSARETGDLQDQERLDSFYIHNWSLWLDVDVLLRTVGVVLRGTGS
jgi:lipopolysaccharide/colanic/teichoic acid biosynthesis glycosyltransferase